MPTLTLHLTLVGTAQSRKPQVDEFESQTLVDTGIDVEFTEEPATASPAAGFLTVAQIAHIFGDNKPSNPGRWFAHGLIFGGEYPGRYVNATSVFTTSPSGELWLMGKAPQDRVRSEFLIFEHNEGGDPDLDHELEHILNVHHADDRSLLTTHFQRHYITVGGLNHVMPGEDGQRWGAPGPPIHNEELHDSP